MSNRYFIRFKGRVLGPMTQEKVIELVQRGQVTRHHELSPDGLQWRLADSFEEFYNKRHSDNSTNRSDSQHLDNTDELMLSEDVGDRKHKALQTDKWFTHVDGTQLGPVEEPAIRQWIGLGKITSETLMWKEGMGEWMAASLVRPQWFSTSVRGGATDQNLKEINGTGLEISTIIFEMRRRNAWVYVVAITMTLMVSVQVIANVFLLIKELVAPAVSGSQAIWSVFLVMLYLAISLIGFVACLRLIQYANIITAMKYAPTPENMLSATQILSLFWFYSGVYILANLLLIALVSLLVFAFGIRLLHLTGQSI